MSSSSVDSSITNAYTRISTAHQMTNGLSATAEVSHAGLVAGAMRLESAQTSTIVTAMHSTENRRPKKTESLICRHAHMPAKYNGGWNSKRKDSVTA